MTDDMPMPDGALARHEWLKWKVRMTGSSYASIAAKLGVKQSSVTIVSQGYRRSAKIQGAIAEIVGIAPDEIWPAPHKPKITPKVPKPEKAPTKPKERKPLQQKAKKNSSAERSKRYLEIDADLLTVARQLWENPNFTTKAIIRMTGLSAGKLAGEFGLREVPKTLGDTKKIREKDVALLSKAQIKAIILKS